MVSRRIDGGPLAAELFGLGACLQARCVRNNMPATVKRTVAIKVRRKSGVGDTLKVWRQAGARSTVGMCSMSPDQASVETQQPIGVREMSEFHAAIVVSEVLGTTIPGAINE